MCLVAANVRLGFDGLSSAVKRWTDQRQQRQEEEATGRSVCKRRESGRHGRRENQRASERREKEREREEKEILQTDTDWNRDDVQ